MLIELDTNGRRMTDEEFNEVLRQEATQKLQLWLNAREDLIAGRGTDITTDRIRLRQLVALDPEHLDISYTVAGNGKINLSVK